MRSSYQGKAISRDRGRRRNPALWLVPLGLLLGCGMAAFLALRGVPLEYRVWEASDIDIQGNRLLLPSEILADLKLGSHPSWIFLDTRKARERLLRNPWVAGASVTRGLWRTIQVRVTERSPEALLPHRGRLAELDPEGVVLPLGGTRLAADLPTLTGLDLDSLDYGRRVQEPRIAASLDFLARCRASHRELWRRISELRVGEPGLVRMVLQGSAAEVWLRPESLNERKMVLLDTVLPDLEKRAAGVRVIDLRFRDQVVLKTDAPENTGGAVHNS
jgi:hypothetical protein